MELVTLPIVRRFLSYPAAYRREQVIISVLSCVPVACGLINPYITKYLVDAALLPGDMKRFILLGAISGGIFIIAGLLDSYIRFLEKRMRLKIQFDLNRRVFAHLQKLPLLYYSDKSTGEHVFKLNCDIESVADMLAALPKEAVGVFPQLLGTAAILFFLDWQIAVCVFLIAPLLYLPSYFFTRRMERVWEAERNGAENVFRFLSEVFSRVHLVKALGTERQEMRRYLHRLARTIRARLADARLEIAASFTRESTYRLALGVLALFGAFQIMRHRISLGSFTAVMIYATQLIGLQQRALAFFQDSVHGLIAFRRIDDILRTRPDEKYGLNKVVLHEAVIEFDKVGFGYLPEEEVIKAATLRLSGGFVALAGASGCGKTTLINLILGLYTPLRGEVRVGGYPTRQIQPFLLDGQVSVALQDPYLWNDSVEHNISYSRPQATFEEIREAAQRAGVDDFVRDLPNGYKTVVGENGCVLSLGQKQKIAIARALLTRPKILLLDEAMSGMDSASEESIVAHLRRCAIPLVILVSHRLSTVLMTDTVCFIREKGDIVTARPQEVARADSEFRQLFAAQIALHNLTQV